MTGVAGQLGYELSPRMVGRLTVLFRAASALPAAVLLCVDCADKFCRIRVLLAAAGRFTSALPRAISSDLAPVANTATLILSIVSLKIPNLNYRLANRYFHKTSLQ